MRLGVIGEAYNLLTDWKKYACETFIAEGKSGESYYKTVSKVSLFIGIAYITNGVISDSPSKLSSGVVIVLLAGMNCLIYPQVTKAINVNEERKKIERSLNATCDRLEAALTTGATEVVEGLESSKQLRDWKKSKDYEDLTAQINRKSDRAKRSALRKKRRELEEKIFNDR